MFKGISSRFRRVFPLALICIFVVGGSYFVLFRHYVESYQSSGSDLVYSLESKLLDLRFLARGKQKPTGRVGILAIDEKSLTSFGSFPFPRKYYKQAFDNLKKLGVKWIGFDAIYPEFEKTKLEDVALEIANASAQFGGKASKQKMSKHLKGLQLTSPGDLTFSESVKDFESIVLGFFFFGSKFETINNLGKDKSKYFLGFEEMRTSELVVDMPEGKTLDSYPLLRKGYGLKSNFPLLNKAASNFAFFSNDSDDDAINRWVTLVANINGSLMPSLSLKVAAEAMDSEVVVFFDDVGVESIELFSRADDSKSFKIRADPTGAGKILLNPRGPSRTFHHYSLVDAYFNRFSNAEKKALKGSVLLLGGTATGTNDIRPNVFDPAIDGVENHAAVIDNIIRGDIMKRPTDIYKTELMIVLGVGILFSPLMIWSSSIFSGFAIFLFLIGYWAFDWMVWFSRGEWAYIAVPSMEIILLFICTTLYKYATEEREKKKVKGAFEHYLSPEVINQVLEDPSTLSLGGSRKEITVFFSDVRGFTTISETLSPEKLCEFMNEYFTPMTGIILDSRGTLDKYIGDAIMAFWGAPIPLENHPAAAATASIRMLFALDKLRHDLPLKGFPKPDIGIGLNTGPMSVGNMGSASRFSYTVMGDAVNLGSRLEGLTKDYQIKIMMSEATAKHLPRNQFHFRDLDDIRVKGKHEPVKVFELMRPDILGSPQEILELIQLFEAGRKHYLAQNWLEAEKCFKSCLNIRSEDGPSAIYLKRTATYLAEEPGESWDGVYTFNHK